MSKESNREVRQRKQHKQDEQKTRRAQKKYKRMVKLTYRHTCGCCHGTAHFNSVESAEKMFTDLGLCNAGAFVDETGDAHTEIDTFYGYSIKEP